MSGARSHSGHFNLPGPAAVPASSPLKLLEPGKLAARPVAAESLDEQNAGVDCADPLIAVLPGDDRFAGGPIALHQLATESFVVTLIPSTQSRVRFSDLAFCPLTEPNGVIEVVMTWSPEREGAVKTAFLDFVRARKELIRKALRNRRPGKK